MEAAPRGAVRREEAYIGTNYLACRYGTALSAKLNGCDIALEGALTPIAAGFLRWITTAQLS
jgi:hypothetical protein